MLRCANNALHYLSSVDDRVCAEEDDCGSEVEASTFVGANVIVKPSDIPSAGNGLFVNVELPAGTRLGYVGGVMICALCVKRKKLTRGKNRFRCIECGVKCNDHGVEVLWYLSRTYNSSKDGPLWYINSCSRKWKSNCRIEFDGFDECEKPLVCVITDTDIRAGCELLLDYFKQ